MPYVPPGQGGVPGVQHPEPGMFYRWLADDPERLSQHLLSHGDRPGYKLCQGPTAADTKKLAAALGFNEFMVDLNRNCIRYGRLLLGQIPTAEAERRRDEVKAESRNKVLDADEAFLNRKRRGVTPFIREVGEIADRQEFSKREGGGRVAVPSTYKNPEASPTSTTSA